MQNLQIHSVPVASVDDRTTFERVTNEATRYWAQTTQAWAWDGGDALVVLTEGISAAVVLRFGDEVKVVPTLTGIMGALGREGYYTTMGLNAGRIPA